MPVTITNSGRCFVVRPLEAADAGACVAIHAAAFPRGWRRSEFDDMLGAEGSVSYGAFLREHPHVSRAIGSGGTPATGDMAGFAIARLAGDDAELLTIATEGRWRGFGAGKLLVDALISALTGCRARRLLLEVADRNEAAMGLYGGFGFREIARRPAYYDDGRCDALLMELPLA